MLTRCIRVRTRCGTDFVDVTDRVQEVVEASGVREGTVLVFSRHTTAAVHINEHEPLLLQDLRRTLARISPPDGAYEHNDLERRGPVPPDEPRNGHSHCQSLALNTSETIPVLDGRMLLGRWQRIFLVELDRPCERELVVQVRGE